MIAQKKFVYLYSPQTNLFIYSFRPTGFSSGTTHPTLSDLSLLSTYSSVRATGAVDAASEYPALNAWFMRAKAAVPNYKEAGAPNCRSDGAGIATGAEEFGRDFKRGMAEMK